MFYLEDSSFYRVKKGKSDKMVKIEKLILKTKAIDNLLLAPIERAPQSYPRKSVNSKPEKLDRIGAYYASSLSWPSDAK